MADRCGRLIALLIMAVSCSASAQTFTWAATVSGEWDDPTDWGDVEFPMDTNDIAIIDIEGAAYVVSLNGFVVDIAEIELTSSDATLSGATGGSVTINDLAIFSDATLAELSFTNLGNMLFDSTLCDELCDVVYSHVGGTITWQNIGGIELLGLSSFDVSDTTTFNITNAQLFTIDDMATFTNNGTIMKSSPGTTSFLRNGAGTFENPGTIELTDGEFDTDALDLVGSTLEEGTWIVRAPSTLNLLGQSVVTNQASITLDGPGASFPAFEANISVNDTTGVIALEGGRSQVTPDDFTNDGLVDVGPGSLFTVDPGSSFTNFSGGAIVGGTLDLEGTFQFDGAAVSSIDADITLDGVGSAIVDDNFDDALVPLDNVAPNGSLAIVNGRDLVVPQPLLMIEGDVRVGPELGGDFSTLGVQGNIDQPSGTTLLDNGSIMHGGMYALSGSGVLRGNGTVTGPIMNSGRIAPGLSPGELQIQPGLLIEPPGVVEIELGGVVPVIEHDRIFVGGLLQFAGGLAGTLEVQLIDGFLPNPGDLFQVIIANEINGQFELVVNPNLPCDLDIEVQYVDDEFDVVQLEVVVNCIGDCNDDGELNMLDFVCFQQEWTLQTLCGDCNGDGAYDILDFICFQNAWNDGCE